MAMVDHRLGHSEAPLKHRQTLDVFCSAVDIFQLLHETLFHFPLETIFKGIHNSYIHELHDWRCIRGEGKTIVCWSGWRRCKESNLPKLARYADYAPSFPRSSGQAKPNGPPLSSMRKSCLRRKSYACLCCHGRYRYPCGGFPAAWTLLVVAICRWSEEVVSLQARLNIRVRTPCPW